MAKITENDIAIIISHLLSANNYERAMLHFLKLAEMGAIMDESDDLPEEKRVHLEPILEAMLESMNKFFKAKGKDEIKVRNLFHIKKFDFIHGALLGRSIQGAVIYFPRLNKGVASTNKRGDFETHFFRITPLPNSFTA